MKSHVRFRGVWQNINAVGTLIEQSEEVVCPNPDMFLWQDIDKKEYWAIITKPATNTYKLDQLEYERIAKLLAEDLGVDEEIPERKMKDPMEQMDV